MDRRIPAVVAAIVSAVTLVAAHPGHGEVVRHTGRVTAVQDARVELEFFDAAATAIRRMWVVTDGQTVVRVGKARLAVDALRIGQNVEFAGETDEGPDGKPMVRAVTFRVKPK